MAKRQSGKNTWQDAVKSKMAAIGAIQPFGQSMFAHPRMWLDSDFLGLNWALGHGIPFGCLWEFIGAESSSKSTTALSLCADLQRKYGALVVPYDTERIDDSMIARTGLDLNLTAIPVDDAKESISTVVNNMMEVIGTIQEAQEEGSYDGNPTPTIIVWDSIAATATQSIKDAMENKRGNIKVGIATEQMGATASQLTSALKTLTPAFARANILAIFINQLRVTIKEGGSAWGGPQEHSGGGRALKHHANIRSKVKRENIYKNFNRGKSIIEDGLQSKGITCTLDMIKNKISAPFKKIEFVNMFGTGIDMYLSNILHAVYDLSDAEVLPPPVQGRIEYKGKKYYPAALAQLLREDQTEWESFKEAVVEAQKTVDSNITPERMAALQARAAEMDDTDDTESEGDLE